MIGGNRRLKNKVCLKVYELVNEYMSDTVLDFEKYGKKWICDIGA